MTKLRNKGLDLIDAHFDEDIEGLPCCTKCGKEDAMLKGPTIYHCSYCGHIVFRIRVRNLKGNKWFRYVVEYRNKGVAFISHDDVLQEWSVCKDEDSDLIGAHPTMRDLLADLPRLLPHIVKECYYCLTFGDDHNATGACTECQRRCKYVFQACKMEKDR